MLTDIQMPIMDGFKVADTILATQDSWAASLARSSITGYYKSKTRVKVVAITAFTDQQVLLLAMQAGITQVIQKPVTHSDLAQIVESYLN